MARRGLDYDIGTSDDALRLRNRALVMEEHKPE
jgi:hypothetical protein